MNFALKCLKAALTPKRAALSPLGDWEARICVKGLLLSGVTCASGGRAKIAAEIAGEIVDIGVEGRATAPWGGFAVGQKVAVRSITACGACESCSLGLTDGCESPRIDPAAIELVKQNGALQLFVRVPATSAHLLWSPKNVSAEEAALLPSTLAMAVSAVHRAHALEHGAAIWGASANALTTLQVLRGLGEQVVCVIDHDPARLDAVSALGGVPIDSSTSDVISALVEQFPDGLFTGFACGDLYNERKAVARMLAQAVEACSVDATIVLLGLSPDADPGISWAAASRKCMSIKTAPSLDHQPTKWVETWSRANPSPWGEWSVTASHSKTRRAPSNSSSRGRLD